MTKTAVIVCPGRGTYNKSELGYIHQNHVSCTELMSNFDKIRYFRDQQTISELDAAPAFNSGVHTRGDNASALIYAASYFDTKMIDSSYDVVAVTGNSMGWYTALAVSGAATPTGAFEVVNTMGTLMQEHLIGGQTLYPFVDEDWREIPGKRAALLERIEEITQKSDHTLALSIDLGGMLVVAGNEAGLKAFEDQVAPVQGRYPMRLLNHAAFHTALQKPVAAAGRDALPEELFRSPDIPLVDGAGSVWYPGAVMAADIRSYTLGAQVVTAYDFTAAIRVAARTFAPDVFIIPGPGTTLGGAVAQALIGINWRGMSSKAAFQERQKTDPVILSMGRAEDRLRTTGGTV
ncbi:MAG: ACP S-malonyltransferase [Roseobacter sp.]